MSQSGLFRDIAFFTSAADEGGLPASTIEVAIVGRSNAGKSSAINTLAQRHRLAFVSKTPGRTQQINFFSMGNGRFLVDLPGYGYAKVPRDLQREWERLISGYLQLRPQLRGLVVVMDSRHPMKDLDAQLLTWFATTGTISVLTSATPAATTTCSTVLAVQKDNATTTLKGLADAKTADEVPFVE